MVAPPLPSTPPVLAPSSSSSLSSPSSSPLVLKVRFVPTGDCRRFPLPVSPPLSFPALLSCVSSLFSLSVSRVELQWRDEECDMVTVASEVEWQRLQRDARDRHQRVLQLSVVEATTPQSHTEQPLQQHSKAASGLDAAGVPSVWQRGVHLGAGQQSMAASPLYPSLAQSALQQQDEFNAQREEKHTVIEQHTYQPPPPPHQLQQSTVASQSLRASSAVSSDDDSPVLIDGSNLPSAADSQVASALWKRHRYKAQQTLMQRRNHHSFSQPPRPALPTTPPIPPSLSLSATRSDTTSITQRSRQQLTAPSSLSASLPSSPLSRSPPSSLPSSSPLQSVLSQQLEKARIQLKQLLPTSLSSPFISSSSPPGGHLASKLTASIATEQERSERIAAAYDLLTSFILDGGKEDELVSRDELLSRCIAMFVYNEKYLSDKKRRNDELATQLGGVEMNRREEEEIEADKRRQLLSEAQRHGLRSLSSSVPISASCSPALVTVMAIVHRYLQSRVVTDVPATLELFAAVLADLTAQVQREENREAALNLKQQSERASQEEVKVDISQPVVQLQPAAAADRKLLASLSRLPAPLRDGVRALLIDCVAYAETAVDVNGSFPSLSSHSFAATLHAFRIDLQDVTSDQMLRPLLRAQSSRISQQATIAKVQPYSEHDEVDDVSPRAIGSVPDSQSQAGPNQLSQQAALFDVGRDDVMLSDRKIMRAVAKAIKKEQREQRKVRKAEEKKRRRTSKGKSDVSAALQQPVDDEEHELHDLLGQMNNTRQQQHSSSVLGDEAVAADNWQLYPQSLAPSVPSVDTPFVHHQVDSFDFVDPNEQHGPPEPLDLLTQANDSRQAQPLSSVDTSSPFSFQPFPYTLSAKQQQASRAKSQDTFFDKAVAATAPSLVSLQPALASDPIHFPSLPLSVARPSYVVASTSPAPPLSPSPSTALPVPQQSFASIVSSHPPPAIPSSSEVQSPRLVSLLQSLHVMGFTDDKLNTWLLHRNGYDLNQTVEWLIVQSEVGLD